MEATRRIRRAPFRPLDPTPLESTPTRACVERLRDELAVVLGNAELLAMKIHGPGSDRLAQLLRGAEAAAARVEELERLLD